MRDSRPIICWRLIWIRAGGVSRGGGCSGGTAGAGCDSALPGVRAVGATNDADLAGDERRAIWCRRDSTPKPDEEFDVELPWVSNGYLQTLGVPLVAGRYFNASDTATSQRVAMVNESFAQHYFAAAQRRWGSR